MSRVSIIIPGRCEIYFQQTIDSLLETATGDIEIIPVIDGYEPNPPLKINDNRVKPIFLKKAIGQRAGYNLGVKYSTGDYIMKLDAHALTSPGFDEVLKSHCPPKTTVLPEMRRLDVDKWKSKKKGKTHFMYFGLDVFCHYWRDYRKREAANAEYPEVLTGQGSCWFMRRDWHDYIGILDESLGSWGKVGIEISLKTWLCGGIQIVNKNAWQAHFFRAGAGRFPYPLSGRQVGRARDMTLENFFFKDSGAFPNQVRPFSWLINKFAPIPGWEAYMIDEYKSNRVIVFYTDSQLDESLARAVRSHLKKVVGPIPIISVSQKPLNFGKNICVGDLLRNQQSMHEQILAGVKVAPENSIIYLCEHDVFYHPSHFAYIPRTDKAIYFNTNRVYWKQGVNTFLPATSKRALSHGVAYREYLIQYAKKRIKDLKRDSNSRMQTRWFTWKSERPNVNIRHDMNLIFSGRHKERYYAKHLKGIKNLPGWGGTKHFQSVTSYKGTLRTDIIQFLIKRYGYKSYLEIGVKGNENFKRIICDVKDGVDPAGHCNYPITSDEFFNQNKKKYDIIFIDGLHLHQQVSKDIKNSLRVLNSNGIIVMHDCNPISRDQQEVPRTKQRIWCGDTWKAFMYYRTRKDLEMYVVDTNNGIGIIRFGKQDPIAITNLTYSEFEKHRTEWLNLISVGRFKYIENNRGVVIPIRQYEPVSEDVMNKTGRVNTICEILREIYRGMSDEHLRFQCRIAVGMAKSMDKKLKKYKRDWGNEYWDRGVA